MTGSCLCRLQLLKEHDSDQCCRQRLVWAGVFWSSAVSKRSGAVLQAAVVSEVCVHYLTLACWLQLLEERDNELERTEATLEGLKDAANLRETVGHS